MRTFSLDMIPGGAQTAVACNQYESGDTWVFALYYDGGRYEIPTGAEVFITGTKPDGAAYKIAGTVVDNAVVIEVTEQMTACAGRSIAEILVESETDGTTLYSANFPLLVEPAAVQGDLSPSEIPSAIVDTDGNVYYESKSILGLYPVESASGDIAVIHDGADDLPVRDLSVAIEPVQAGSGDPSPSNVRAISGWDAVKVTRADGIVCEKNNSWANASGIVEASAPYVGYIFRCEQDKRYYYKFNGTAGHNIVAAFYTEYPNVGVRSYNGSRLANLPNNSSIVAPINGYGLIRNVVANPLINIGTVDSYEPMPEPVSDTHTITLPTTVYGGTLDVTKGILTVTKGLIASYAGETLPGAWISDRDVYAAGATPTTGAQVVYDLASHQTYTLTPVQVKTLLGENRIYADAGDVTVEYRADFNEAGLMYIPKAPTADGSYRLTADVTGGTPTYRWEAAE